MKSVTENKTDTTPTYHKSTIPPGYKEALIKISEITNKEKEKVVGELGLQIENWPERLCPSLLTDLSFLPAREHN